MRRNVLFLMVDCMRADILWDRRRYPSLPNFDALKARSSSFNAMITAATTTTPSVATILTGRYPSEHGVRSLLGFKLQPDVKTLAEALKEHGYNTFAEVTGPLFPITGLGRGFDVYNRRERHWYLDTAWGTQTLAKLAAGLPEPWFMFLHLWELHWPRKAKGEFASPRYGKQLYQRSVAYLDSQLPRILDTIDPEKTVVVITGDHGEGIAGAIDDPRPWVQFAISAGYRLTKGLPSKAKKRILTLGKKAVLAGQDQQELAGHAQLCVYDYLIRVPLIVSAPGLLPEGKSIDTQVRHVDIAPTVLDAVGIDPAPYGMQPSLVPMMWGDDTVDRPAVSEALQTMLHDDVNRLVGLRTGKYKYIAAPENPSVPEELYDLETDPGEKRNLALEQPTLLAELREQLRAAQNGRSSGAVRMSAEEEAMVKDRLEALGYIE
ncbi:MAG: sulfatase-like hydrolase/transferase [Chloroflexota bacterium]|nr:sulfatase-like hydrolase/transferase [Chloroflexota bacterium]